MEIINWSKDDSGDNSINSSYKRYFIGHTWDDTDLTFGSKNHTAV